MRRKGRIFCLAGCFCSLFMLIGAHLFAQGSGMDEFPEEALSTMPAALAQFIFKIPRGHFSDYGFSTEDEMVQAELGAPFHLYVIDPLKVLNFEPGTTVSQLTEATKQWFFPVKTAQGIKAMLLVEENRDGEYQAVSFGYQPLAAGLKRLLGQDAWHDATACRLVVVYQAKEFFMTKPALEPYTLYPLQFDNGGGQQANDSLEFNMARIREQVEASINGRQ